MSVQSIGICKCYTQYLRSSRFLNTSGNAHKRLVSDSGEFLSNVNAGAQRRWTSEGMPWPRILETIASTVPPRGF